MKIKWQAVAMMAHKFELGASLLWVLLSFSPVRWQIFCEGQQLHHCPSECICTEDEYAPTADCSAQNLTGVPRGLSALTASLNLNMNNIQNLPNYAFSELKFIKDLHLAGNHLTDLPIYIFSGILHLESLHLQGNLLTKVPNTALRNLHYLQQLHLDANMLTTIPPDSFQGMRFLKQLWLDDNELTKIPTDALSHLKALEATTFAVNKIESIPSDAFAQNKRLVVLLLHSNNISLISPDAFNGLSELKILELNHNLITEVPSGLRDLVSLEELNLANNKIKYIDGSAFIQNPRLRVLELAGNPIVSLGVYAFNQLPYLSKLIISNAKAQVNFPDLSGSGNIKILGLDGGQLGYVPNNLCEKVPLLETLDLHGNQIQELPLLTNCKELKVLNIGNNSLTSIQGGIFSKLIHLEELTISYNKLTKITRDAFKNLHRLQYLSLDHNKIESVHENAFANLISLEYLDFGHNDLTTLPTKGLQNLISLKMPNNPKMLNSPSKKDFPQVQQLVLAYAYHCCQFSQAFHSTWEQDESDRIPLNEIFNTEIWKNDSGLFVNSNNTLLWNGLDPTNTVYNLSKDGQLVYSSSSVDCRPEPGPMMPCHDLIGWWSLRCGVWVIFLSAVFGNLCVSLASVCCKQSPVDGPSLLLCNLAWSNFCMGCYVGFIAVVDSSTLGSFGQYALQWQFSSGCQIAGFLAMFSTELTIVTLAVMIISHLYYTKYSQVEDSQITVKQAGISIAVSWLFSLLMAALPLIHVSSYSKFALCLPMDMESTSSRGYIGFLSFFNIIVLLVTTVCAVKCYCLSMTESHNPNSTTQQYEDYRRPKYIAPVMFLSVVCWVTLAILAFVRVLGKELIGGNEVKIFTVFILPLTSSVNPIIYVMVRKPVRCCPVRENAGSKVVVVQNAEARVGVHKNDEGVDETPAEEIPMLQLHQRRIQDLHDETSDSGMDDEAYSRGRQHPSAYHAMRSGEPRSAAEMAEMYLSMTPPPSVSVLQHSVPMLKRHSQGHHSPPLVQQYMQSPRRHSYKSQYGDNSAIGYQEPISSPSGTPVWVEQSEFSERQRHPTDQGPCFQARADIQYQERKRSYSDLDKRFKRFQKKRGLSHKKFSDPEIQKVVPVHTFQKHNMTMTKEPELEQSSRKKSLNRFTVACLPSNLSELRLPCGCLVKGFQHHGCEMASLNESSIPYHIRPTAKPVTDSPTSPRSSISKPSASPAPSCRSNSRESVQRRVSTSRGVPGPLLEQPNYEKMAAVQLSPQNNYMNNEQLSMAVSPSQFSTYCPMASIQSSEIPHKQVSKIAKASETGHEDYMLPEPLCNIVPVHRKKSHQRLGGRGNSPRNPSLGLLDHLQRTHDTDSGYCVSSETSDNASLS